VDQIAVDTAIAIGERVNVDKSERQNRGSKDGVEVRRGVAVERNQTLD
jgi:hypothetical protein